MSCVFCSCNDSHDNSRLAICPITCLFQLSTAGEEEVADCVGLVVAVDGILWVCRGGPAGGEALKDDGAAGDDAGWGEEEARSLIVGELE